MIGGLIRGLHLTAALKRSAGEVRLSVRRTVQRAALLLGALLLLGIGFGFLVTAGFIVLADEIGAVEASIVFGLVFVVVGAGVLAALAARRRHPVTPFSAVNPASPLTKSLLDVGQD